MKVGGEMAWRNMQSKADSRRRLETALKNRNVVDRAGGRFDCAPVKLNGLVRRIAPVSQKLAGRLPLCPWQTVLSALNPRTLDGHPPRAEIETVEEKGELKRLRFANKHDFWFPLHTVIDAELWSEYLGVFWDHPANGHYYLRQRTLLNPGDVCLDCGACEGFFVQQALDVGVAKVVCLEPSADMVNCLSRSFGESVEKGRVSIVQAAIGAIDGSASFTFDSTQPFSGRVTADRSQPEVRVATIDTVCRELGLDRVDFIKMDIEGAEIQAVEGALGVLQRDFPKLAITTYHRAFDYSALQAFLVALGYRHIRAAGITTRGDGRHRPMMLHASR